jgi:homoserine kinase
LRINKRDIPQEGLSKKKTGSMVYRIVKARAPSSTANLGPGFDVFGLALDLFHDIVEVEFVADGLTLTVEGVDHERVSTAVQKNAAGLVAKTVMDTMKKKGGLRIKLIKGVPVGVGLGSSAASAAACVRALDEMFSLTLDSEQLVGLAAQGEVASAGTAHFDNAAAAILGYFVIISQKPLSLMNLKPPRDLEVAITIPKIDLGEEKTKMMRGILPKAVDLDRVTHNVAHASLFAAGMVLSDIEMMGRAMSDSIVEPVRSRTIPMFTSVKTAALDTGASGFAISGAGPAVLALCNRVKVNTRDVAHAMKEAFEKGGVPSAAYCSKPSGGCTIIERR